MAGQLQTGEILGGGGRGRVVCGSVQIIAHVANAHVRAELALHSVPRFLIAGIVSRLLGVFREAMK